MPRAERYTLTVTAEQARVLQKACELLARLHIGQFDEIGPAVNAFEIGGRTGHEHYRETATELRQAIFSKPCERCGGKGSCTSDEGFRFPCGFCNGGGRRPILSPTGSYGIASEEVPDEARVCWDLYSLIRHRLAWDGLEEGEKPNRMLVCYDDPTRLSKEPQAKIERNG